MTQQHVERRLAAILAADVVGYSRLMGVDEEGTLAALKTRRDIIDRLVGNHRGRVFGSAGDSVVVEFSSPVDAVRCAVEIQQAVNVVNVDRPTHAQMLFRIGINLGDVMVQGENLLGDGVNVAARIEAMADPGSIFVSSNVFDFVKDTLAVVFENHGRHSLKNIAEPVHVYRVPYRVDVDPSALSAHEHPEEDQNRPGTQLHERPAIAVLPFTNPSPDAEQEYFSDGLTEDLITALASWRTFPVISRASSFVYKNHNRDAREIARELDARYILDGSVGGPANVCA